MTRAHAGYEIDDDADRIDVDAMRDWLATTYWWEGVTREQVAGAIRGSSMTIGAYQGARQVGVARVVSDAVRFAWIADVFVAPEHRGRGIARAMIRFALDHPRHATVTRWMLATRDAHGVYAALGFVEPDADELLELRRQPTGEVDLTR